jgi:hypothetical protein
MVWGELIGGFVGSIVGAIIGACIGAYFGKRAERLAIQHDLDKIVAEVRVVTAHTEQIKSEITGAMWLRQTVWTEKKMLYHSILNTISRLLATLQAWGAHVAEGRNTAQQIDAYMKHSTDFLAQQALSLIMLGEDVAGAFAKYNTERTSPSGLEDLEWFGVQTKQLVTLQAEIASAAKADLLNIHRQ